jgi:hypothetical protein
MDKPLVVWCCPNAYFPGIRDNLAKCDKIKFVNIGESDVPVEHLRPYLTIVHYDGGRYAGTRIQTKSLFMASRSNYVVYLRHSWGNNRISFDWETNIPEKEYVKTRIGLETHPEEGWSDTYCQFSQMAKQNLSLKMKNQTATGAYTGEPGFVLLVGQGHTAGCSMYFDDHYVMMYESIMTTLEYLKIQTLFRPHPGMKWHDTEIIRLMEKKDYQHVGVMDAKTISVQSALQNCSLVICLNSFVGLEALFLNKPVATLCPTDYHHLVTPLKDRKSLFGIGGLLNHTRYTPEEASNFLGYLYQKHSIALTQDAHSTLRTFTKGTL